MEKPFAAYQGDAPYIFVCYAHDDEAIVYPDIQRLHEQGLNFWYDEGISAGTVWRAEILKALQSAAKVLYYISESSLNSIHCNREIDYAIDKLPVIPVYLDESELTPELGLALHRVQGLRYSDDPRYQQQLLEALSAATQAPSLPVRVQKKGNRNRVVGAGLVLAGLIGGAWWYTDRVDSTPQVTGSAAAENAAAEESHHAPIIAVLPLANISGDDSQDYFSEGFTQEIWRKVRAIPGLRVIATSSSSRYADSMLGATEIGNQLNADYLVEGTVNRSGNLVRVSVNLIDAKTAQVTLYRDYDQAIDDVESLFAIYDELADDIGSALTDWVGSGGDAAKRSIASLQAYDLMQKGVWELWTNYRPVEALALLNQAFELDPDSLEIQESRLFALFQVAETGNVPSRVGYEVARQAATKILADDPGNPNALYIQANLALAVDLKAREALDGYDAAEAAGYIGPGISIFRMLAYVNAGYPDDAVALGLEAELLDPMYAGLKTFLAVSLYHAGDVEASHRKMDEALALEPGNRLWSAYSIQYAARAQDVDRLRRLVEAGQEQPGVLPSFALQLLQLLEGDPEPLKDLLTEWEANLEHTFVSPNTFSQLYYFLGDYGNHMRWFAVQEEERTMLHLTHTFHTSEPNYWENLETWANETPDQLAERQALLKEHRERIARVMKNMVF